MNKVDKEKLFVRIENESITNGSKYHLTDKELYLFSLLYMDKRLDETVLTTLSLISSFMPIRFASQDVRNVKAIKEALSGLSNKETLSILSPQGELIDIEKLKASDSIKVLLKRVPSKGHVQVPYIKMEECDTIQDFYIFAAVKRWDNGNKGGSFICDYDRFSQILGVSRSTAQRNIEDALDRKLIYRNIGDFSDMTNEIRQDINQYRCTPFTDEEKTRMTKRIEYENRYSPDSIYEDLDLTYDSEEIEHFFLNWDRIKDDLTDKFYMPDKGDVKFYLEVKKSSEGRKPTEMEYRLIDKAEWRMEKILNSYPDAINEFKGIYSEALLEFELEQTDREAEQHQVDTTTEMYNTPYSPPLKVIDDVNVVFGEQA